MRKIILSLSTAFAMTTGAMAQADSVRTTELNPVVITGTGTYHRADNSPVAVKVISVKDIKNAQATSIQDALTKLTPNITLHTNGMGTFVNFNGVSDDYILIMENGKRVSGDDRWSRISLDNVKRIEIFSGAASALYGSDAIAGVINIITDDTKEQVNVSSRSKVMNNGRYTQDVNLDVTAGKFSGELSYNHNEADNWQLNKWQEFTEKDKDGNTSSVLKPNGRPMSQAFKSNNVSEQMEWKFNDQWSVYLRGNYYDYKTERPHEADAYTQKKTTDKATGEVKYSYTRKNAYTYDLHHNSYLYGGGLRWTPNKDVHVYLDAYCDNFVSRYNYWATDQKARYSETRKRTHYINENLRGIFRLAKWNKLSAGMEFVQETLNSQSDNIDFETNNTYNVFAQDEIQIVRDLEAVAGVRYTYNDNFGSHVTPNVALFYHTGGLKVRASYAGGYRTPTLSQLYATDQAKTNSRYTINNPDLKPETNHFLNLNVEYGNRWMTVGLTGFRNQIQDMINYRTMTEEEIGADAHLKTLHEDWTTIRTRDNIDNAVLSGVSANLKFVLPFGLTVGGGYTFTDSQAKTKTLNTKTQQYVTTKLAVDKAVKHVGNVNVSYGRTWGVYRLDVAVNGHLQGRRYSSTYGYADGYTQWDLTTRHAFTLRDLILEPGVGVENLLNKRDRSYWTSNYSTISPGRSYFVSMAVRFKN